MKLSLTAVARGETNGVAHEPQPEPEREPQQTSRRSESYPTDIHRLLPQDADAEKGVLGSILQSPKEVMELCETKRVTKDWFHIPSNQAVWEALEYMHTERTAEIDIITLTAEMRGEKKLEDIGGPAFLTDLFTFMPTAANATYYLDILEEKKTLRDIITVCTKYSVLAYNADAEATNLSDELHDKVSRIVNQRYCDSVKDVTEKTFAALHVDIEARENGTEEPLGMLTGVPCWDHSLHGIFHGEMTVLAARPSVGKTAAMETAIETLIYSGKHVLVVQKDISAKKMLGRMAARHAGLVYERFKLGVMTSGELSEFKTALTQLQKHQSKLHILDTASMTPGELDAAVRASKREHAISAFFLDHFFQLKMKTRGGENLSEAATDASGVLKRCIHETGVAGVILVHINREGGKADHPNGSHIKYCDALLADADNVIILWSEQTGSDLKKDERQEIVFTVEKNNVGGVGDERMYFHRETMTFEQI